MASLRHRNGKSKSRRYSGSRQAKFLKDPLHAGLAAREEEMAGLRDLLFAKRMMDFCEEFPCEDPDLGYAKAITRLVEMAYSGADQMEVRGILYLCPDISYRQTRQGPVWGACLSMGLGEDCLITVTRIRFKGNVATVSAKEIDILLRYGTDLEALYKDFLAINPDAPGDGVHWNYRVGYDVLNYSVPEPLHLDFGWEHVLECMDGEWREGPMPRFSLEDIRDAKSYQ